MKQSSKAAGLFCNRNKRKKKADPEVVVFQPMPNIENIAAKIQNGTVEGSKSLPSHSSRSSGHGVQQPVWICPRVGGPIVHK